MSITFRDLPKDVLPVAVQVIRQNVRDSQILSHLTDDEIAAIVVVSQLGCSAMNEAFQKSATQAPPAPKRSFFRRPV